MLKDKEEFSGYMIKDSELKLVVDIKNKGFPLKIFFMPPANFCLYMGTNYCPTPDCYYMKADGTGVLKIPQEASLVTDNCNTFKFRLVAYKTCKMHIIAVFASNNVQQNNKIGSLNATLNQSIQNPVESVGDYFPERLHSPKNKYSSPTLKKISRFTSGGRPLEPSTSLQDEKSQLKLNSIVNSNVEYLLKNSFSRMHRKPSKSQNSSTVNSSPENSCIQIQNSVFFGEEQLLKFTKDHIVAFSMVKLGKKEAEEDDLASKKPLPLYMRPLRHKVTLDDLAREERLQFEGYSKLLAKAVQTCKKRSAVTLYCLLSVLSTMRDWYHVQSVLIKGKAQLLRYAEYI